MRMTRLAALVLLALPFAVSGSTSRQVTLAQPAQLSMSPGAPAVAVLMSGAVVHVGETRDGWSRVTMDGWVPAGTLPGEPASGAPPAAPVPPAGDGAAPAASPAAPPGPAAASAGPADHAALTGVAYVTGKDARTIPAAQTAVRLLGADAAGIEGLAALQAECAGRRETLVARAAELKDQAGRALRTIESPSQAFQQNDAAKAERRKVLAELSALDQDCQSREDVLLESHAAHRTITDAEGRFAFGQVAPGSYTVQATFQAEGQRHRWMRPVALAAGDRATLDLTTVNRTSVEPAPQLP